MLALALAVVGLGSGCCSFTEGANRITVNAKTKATTRENPNCGLDDKAPIQNASAAYQGDILQCNVQVTSTVSEQMNLEYKFEWYDADGFLLKDTSGWNNLILDAGANPTVNGSSPKPNAEKVTFSMRPVKAIK